MSNRSARRPASSRSPSVPSRGCRPLRIVPRRAPKSTSRALSPLEFARCTAGAAGSPTSPDGTPVQRPHNSRSEEHTSELQSPCNLGCRPLLQKKNLRDGRARVPAYLRPFRVICIDKSMPKVQNGALQFFFFNDTATTEIYTFSLHDALPI